MLASVSFSADEVVKGMQVQHQKVLAVLERKVSGFDISVPSSLAYITTFAKQVAQNTGDAVQGVVGSG